MCLDEHVCGLVGQANGSKFHPDLPAWVATNVDIHPGLPLSRRVYVKVGYHYLQKVVMPLLHVYKN